MSRVKKSLLSAGVGKELAEIISRADVPTLSGASTALGLLGDIVLTGETVPNPCKRDLNAIDNWMEEARYDALEQYGNIFRNKKVKTCGLSKGDLANLEGVVPTDMLFAIYTHPNKYKSCMNSPEELQETLRDNGICVGLKSCCTMINYWNTTIERGGILFVEVCGELWMDIRGYLIPKCILRFADLKYITEAVENYNPKSSSFNVKIEPECTKSYIPRKGTIFNGDVMTDNDGDSIVRIPIENILKLELADSIYPTGLRLNFINARTSTTLKDVTIPPSVEWFCASYGVIRDAPGNRIVIVEE